jgi:CRP-like cAMP-binding protein
VPAQDVNQEFLKGVALLQELEDDDLTQLLMVGLVKQYARGATILSEGAPGGRLCIIHRGEVRISKVVPGVGEEALAILGAGDFFGEIEFLDGAPASASALAHTDCEVFAIPHHELQGLMRARPALGERFLGAFARTLAHRLRETNKKIVGLVAISRVF